MISFILPVINSTNNIQKQQTKAEKELIEALKSGEAMALEKLYHLYAASLLGIIHQITRHEELAEDILQESFIKIWRSIAQYDSDKGRLFTWMARLCKNTAIDHLRSRRELNRSKNESLEELMVEVNLEHYESYNPETIDLRNLIKLLSPVQTQILNLLYFEGYTQVEVAEELAIPIGTIKTRVRTAIKTLRSFY